MISVEQAWDHLIDHALPRASELISVREANGRQLAKPVKALISKPQVNQSSMDGYAVRLQDVCEPDATLNVVGEVRAGEAPSITLQKNEAVRIFTGASLPSGADHILIQETVSRDGDTITYDRADEQPRWVRQEGLDFSAGDILVDAGTRLDWRHIALISSANITHIEVFRAPHVAIITNGDELRPPGSNLEPHQTVDALGPALEALLKSCGCTVSHHGPLPDDTEAVRQALSAIDADFFVPVGGASVGDYDHMQDAFAALGFEPIFSKVAVRPGKPSWFSRRDNACVMGLPGNPVSALVCAQLFLKPLLTAQRPVLRRLPLEADLLAEGPREHFRRGTWTEIGVSSFPDQDSSRLGLLANADVLIRRIADAPAAKSGEFVEAILI
ncbi:MAG: molybdopterin molybdotransferase MoeA [Pseudomonadota bacterium]